MQMPQEVDAAAADEQNSWLQEEIQVENVTNAEKTDIWAGKTLNRPHWFFFNIYLSAWTWFS